MRRGADRPVAFLRVLASRWMLIALGRPVLVCLPVCGFVSGNRAHPREMADSRVLATARHIHICLRVAVLRDSSNFRGFRPARPYETAVLFQNLVSVGFPLGLWPRPSKRYAFFGGYPAQNKAARGTSGRVRRVESALGFSTVPHGDAPASFARHSRRDAASPEYRLLASLAPVGAIREPHPRVSLRSALDHSPRFLITC